MKLVIFVSKMNIVVLCSHGKQYIRNAKSQYFTPVTFALNTGPTFALCFSVLQNCPEDRIGFINGMSKVTSVIPSLFYTNPEMVCNA